MLNVSFKRFQRILERRLHHYHQQQYQYQYYTFPPQFPFNFKHKSLSNFSKSRLSLLFTLHNKQINQETIFIKPQDTKIKKSFEFFSPSILSYMTGRSRSGMMMMSKKQQGRRASRCNRLRCLEENMKFWEIVEPEVGRMKILEISKSWEQWEWGS